MESQNPKVKDESFSVSPNPTTGNIRVRIVSNTNKVVTFELSNVQGKVLLQERFQSPSFGGVGEAVYSINLNKNGKLSTGIYFLKAIGLDGENVKRIIMK